MGATQDEARTDDQLDVGSEVALTTATPRRGWGDGWITTLPLGQSPATNLRAVRPLIALTFVTWIVTGALIVMCVRSHELPVAWLIATGLSVVIAAFTTATLRVHADDVIGQWRAARRLRSATARGGLAIGLIGAIAVLSPETLDPNDVARQLREGHFEAMSLTAMAGLLAAMWAAVVMIRTPSALKAAFSEQARIARLRATGERLSGRLSVDRNCNNWFLQRPQTGARVSLAGPRGSEVCAVRLRVSSDRVPVAGTPVIVFRDGREFHVDLDPNAPLEFYPPERYAVPDG